MPREKRIRASSDEQTRANREKLLRLTHVRVKVAIEAGFYIEAIALIESILADRIESKVAYLGEAPVEHLTVNQGINALNSYGVILDHHQLFDEVKLWANGRSKWIHEFAKLSTNEEFDWERRISDAAQVAIEGQKLLTRLNSALRKIT